MLSLKTSEIRKTSGGLSDVLKVTHAELGLPQFRRFVASARVPCSLLLAPVFCSEACVQWKNVPWRSPHLQGEEENTCLPPWAALTARAQIR